MKTGTKAIVVSALLALALIPAFAGTTASLALSGTVAKTASISVSATSEASNLNLTSATATTVTVATVTEICNSNSGYTVSVSSANAGYLKGALSANADSVAYSLFCDGTAVALSSSGTVMVAASAKTSGNSQTLAVNYTGNATLSADSYSDILTFTIAAL